MTVSGAEDGGRGAEDGGRGAEENGESSLVVKYVLLAPGIKMHPG